MFNKTLGGALIRGVAPGSVCFPSEPNYSEEACSYARTQWFNSTWHTEDPVSVDYPIWTNNSCNPIWPNGTSVTGDANAGTRGCSIGAYPAYIVNATTSSQVGATLKWASTWNIRIIVKSTGHSYPGRSIGFGSLSIWTHHLRNIEYLEDFGPTACESPNTTYTAARIAAGHTVLEVQAAVAKHGAIAVTGANPDVGVIGWLTGGGHGPLSRTYGMGADNLLEATIVTPDGTSRLANPCNNADLFFAIRGGGGGTFGVVTEIVVRTYPTPRTTSHTFQLTSRQSNASTEFWDLIAFLHTEMPRLKKGGMQGYYFIVGPPVVPTLSFLWTFQLFDQPNGTVEELMEPIATYLNQRVQLFAWQSNLTYADTYFESYISGGINNELVANGGSAYGSRLLTPESLADAQLTAKVFADIGPTTDASKPNVSLLPIKSSIANDRRRLSPTPFSSATSSPALKPLHTTQKPFQ